MPRTTANFNMGGNYPTTRQQHQQGGNAVSNSGISFTTANNQDLIHLHGSDLFSSQHGTYHSQVIFSFCKLSTFMICISDSLMTKIAKRGYGALQCMDTPLHYLKISNFK
jgi:hypothetical protein